MPDTPRIAHSAGRKDDLRHGIRIDGLGILLRHAGPKPFKPERIYPAPHQFPRLRVQIFRGALQENARCLIGQRTVHINRESVVPVHPALLLDLPDKIQHFLRAAHSKGGNDHRAAPVKGLLQDLRQRAHIIRALTVQPVAVGGFQHQIICLLHPLRVVEDGLMRIPHVTAEHHLFGNAALAHPYLNGGGAKQMPDIRKAHRNAFANGRQLVVRARTEAG